MAEQQAKDNLPKRLFPPGSLIGVYAPGTTPPPDTTLPPAEAVKSTEETFGCKVRIGVMESEEKFPGPVNSWHVHHYFNNSSPDEVREAMELRWDVMNRFPNISVNKIFRHAPELDGFKKTAPVGQWELELHTPQQLSTYLPWVVANHGNLRVLCHPNSADADGKLRILKDHTTDCFWLGKKEGDPDFAAEVETMFTKMMKNNPGMGMPAQRTNTSPAANQAGPRSDPMYTAQERAVRSSL